MTADGDLRTRQNKAMGEACEAAKTFQKLYYDVIDNRRDRLDRLIRPDAVLMWNGHRLEGADNIKKFMQDLPKSRHEIQSVDVQPLMYAVPHQTTVALKFGGMVTYEGGDQRTAFAHSFLITSDDGETWKIVSETYRFFDPTFGQW